MPPDNHPTNADPTEADPAGAESADNHPSGGGSADSESARTESTALSQDGAVASQAVETVVPAEATAHRCPYCDRPFADPDRVTLHVGLEHYDVCTDAEVEAFQAAYTAENEEIRRYRLKAAAALILVYFGLLMVYAVFGVAG